MRRKTVPPMVWAAVLAAGVYENGMNLFQLLERSHGHLHRHHPGV